MADLYHNTHLTSAEKVAHRYNKHQLWQGCVDNVVRQSSRSFLSFLKLPSLGCNMSVHEK